MVFQGILFVLFTGIGWKDLPQELGFGSGMTCWRRLRDWQAAGVFEAMHQAVLDRSNAAGLIDFDRVMIDGSHARAKRGRRDRTEPGRPWQDRLQTPPVDLRQRVPLVVELSTANVNDHMMLAPVLDRVRPLRGRPGPPRRRIKNLITDKGYDYPACTPSCGNAGSPATSRAAELGTRSPPAAGSWSRPSPCSTSTGAWLSAGNAASTSTTDS